MHCANRSLRAVIFASTDDGLCSRDLNERRSHCGRLRNRIAGLAQTVEVEGDRFADELLHFFASVAHDADTGKVGAVGTPGVAFVLDHNQVLGHLLGLRSPA